MSQGLSVSRLVTVQVNLSPLAPPTRGFGSLLIIGDSNVINVSERIRSYSDITGVTTDFGTSAPEFLAAQLYFGQTPRPGTLFIGRWAQSATSGFIEGAPLTLAQQMMSAWTVITAGAFDITIDSMAHVLTGLNFSAQVNLNGVAAVITTALAGAGVCSWDGTEFKITSTSTGVSSIVTYATSPIVGTDISALLKLTAATGLPPVVGAVAEQPVDAINVLQNLNNDWYGSMFASTVIVTDDQHVENAAFIQALEITRIYGVTIIDTRVLDASFSNDLASRLMALGYTRTCPQYSPNPYAVASIFGRAFSVDFTANRSTITLMYKQEPGVNPENLTNTQADTLKAKRCNVFVEYNNTTSILQYGVMSGPAYFDEIHGLDWFQNAVQNAIYTLLYTTTTKIPQTDAGSNQIVNEIGNVCEQAVSNGLVAPGQWNGDSFGQLLTGQFLKNGYYTYAEPMALQSQADRDSRVAPPITTAIKLAGAIQEVNVITNVNR